MIGTGIAIYALFANSTALSAEESRLIDLVPPKLGTHCRSYDPGFDQRFAPLVSASVKCQPIDAGPDSLKFHLFTTPEDLRTFIRRLLVEMYEDGVNCGSDFGYAAPWVDRGGKVVGELICSDYEGLSRLLWSYDDLLLIASAGAPPEQVEDLHRWWQRQVRYDGAEPPRGPRQYLRSLLPPSFGKCEPLRVLLPMSMAGVICEPGDGISSAGAQLFSSRELLAEYIEERADKEGIDSDSCEDTPFSYMSYGSPPTYRPIRGWLLCIPQFGAEWFEWTAIRPRVYAFASREDNDFEKLYRQWSRSLSWIKHLND